MQGAWDAGCLELPWLQGCRVPGAALVVPSPSPECLLHSTCIHSFMAASALKQVSS